MKTKIINTVIVSFFTLVVLTSFEQKKEEKVKITKQNLMGAYGGDEETENAYFGIYKDSIYYPDSNIWVKYQLKGDTIVITNYDDSIEKLLILKLTTDSLVVNNLNYDMENHLNRRTH